MTAFVAGLYVIATPIGNLQDLSPRARSVLAEASVVAAEDTRTSGKLLKLAGGEGRMVSLTEHNTAERIPHLLEAAREGVVALLSDAGTPVIADPGARLVEAAHAHGVPVFAIAGPSALAAALSVAGFEGSDVHFLGFLPKKHGDRIARLQAAASTASVLVYFESPNRLSGSLTDLAEALNDPEVVVCRELTKLHEEVVRGRASSLAQRFRDARGECTVVVRAPEQRAAAATELTVEAFLAAMKRAGAQRSTAAAEAARAFGTNRSEAYELWSRL
ncbi:MAG TPA: 16S rRNA (cytidine(1402)-2'-O)-methyltransferase [Tepidiformaceae bacterium]